MRFFVKKQFPSHFQEYFERLENRFPSYFHFLGCFLRFFLSPPKFTGQNTHFGRTEAENGRQARLKKCVEALELDLSKKVTFGLIRCGGEGPKVAPCAGTQTGLGGTWTLKSEFLAFYIFTICLFKNDPWMSWSAETSELDLFKEARIRP